MLSFTEEAPDEEDKQNQSFEIPELPEGKVLEVVLLDNWGDPNYIGLNAVEIFTKDGSRARVQKISSCASAYVGDVRSLLVESLLCTDSTQMWCAPIQQTPIKISIEFAEVYAVAMVRIWNYNQSRVHSQKGVRKMCLNLDGKQVFKGEITQAFTTDTECEPMGDTVLFTMDEVVLEAIARNDICLIDIQPINNSRNGSETNLLELTPFRPITSEKRTTSPGENKASIAEERRKELQREESLRPRSGGTAGEQGVHLLPGEIRAKVLHIELAANWGAIGVIGLTGIQLLGQNTAPVNTNGAKITVSNNAEGIERLFNGRNLTRNPLDMWICPFDSAKPPIITINFQSPIILTGVSIWNYNESAEMSYSGVRIAQFYANSKLVLGNSILRKAPGYVFFDYVQDVFFARTSLIPSIRPTTRSIDGFIFQLRLLSTWGDEFYIGLNGVELLNREGKVIRILPQNMAAFPESVNILPMVNGDPRSSENLINGENDTNRPENMWLTPQLPNRCARVFFVFDEPTFVSKILVYNYRKTPERGVRHISVSVDDIIVYSGEVPPSTKNRTGVLEIEMRED